MMKSILKNKGARALFVAAVSLLAGLTAAAPPQAPSSRTLRSMARAYIAFGRYDKAEVLAIEALAQARNHKAGDAELAMCLIDLGTLYQYQDRLAEAEATLTAGIALQKQAPEPNPYLAYTLRMLSSVHRRRQQYEQARAILEEATAIMLHDYRSDDPALALFRTEQAKLLADQGRFEEARDIYRTALTAVEDTYGRGHLCTANVCEEAAEVDLQLGRLEEATGRIDRTIRIRETYYGAGHPMNIPAWFIKARICRAAGDAAGSEQHIDKALAAAAALKDPVRLARLHRQASHIRGNVQLARL